MRLQKSVLITIVYLLVLMPFAAFAGGDEAGESLYNYLFTWLPVLLIVVWFTYIIKQYSKLHKRSYEHMDKAEQLLERIANAVERNQK